MIEDQIYQRLAGDQQLAALLARFGGRPAIFPREAPPDDSSGWNGVQWPRIVFLLDRTQSQTDVMQGTLHVTIWTREGEGGALADILARVHALLDGWITYAPEDGLASLNGVPAEIPLPAGSAGPLRVMGMDVMYRVQVIPPTVTYEPDPVATMMRWSGQYLDPRVKVQPDQWAPADDAPALYWRVVSARTRVADMEWWGYWVDVDLVGHVLAPTAYARGVWTRYVADNLRLPHMRRIRMGDGSPLMVNSVTEVRNTNPQTTGQLQLSARFGMLTTSVPTGLDQPPVVPPGQLIPPPVWTPAPPPGFVWQQPPQYVSNIDTGVELDIATLTLVPDVGTLPAPPTE